MNVRRAIAQGLSAVARAPGLVLALWLVNVLAALPAAWLMRDALAESIGPSLFHRTLTEGFDGDWWAEFDAETDGLADAFSPSVLGAGAVYDNLEAWWSGRLFESHRGLLALGVAYALLWSFLLGGVFERLGRPGPGAAAGAAGFFAASGRTFGRFVQLAAGAGVAYYLVYRLARLLFGRLEEATREVTEERTVLLGALAIAAVVVLLLHLVRLTFDYAKIAVAVGEPGLGAPRALLRGLRFVAGRPAGVLGVYLVLGLVALALVALYAVLAPGAGQASALTIVLAFLGSQLYLASRLAVRLSLLGAELHLFRAARAGEVQPAS